MYATVSIINVYKEGSLAIQQAGKTMSTKIIILCKKCPLIRRGEFAGEFKLAVTAYRLYDNGCFQSPMTLSLPPLLCHQLVELAPIM